MDSRGERLWGGGEGEVSTPILPASKYIKIIFSGT